MHRGSHNKPEEVSSSTRYVAQLADVIKKDGPCLHGCTPRMGGRPQSSHVWAALAVTEERYARHRCGWRASHRQPGSQFSSRWRKRNLLRFEVATASASRLVRAAESPPGAPLLPGVRKLHIAQSGRGAPRRLRSARPRRRRGASERRVALLPCLHPSNFLHLHERKRRRAPSHSPIPTRQRVREPRS